MYSISLFTIAPTRVPMAIKGILTEAASGAVWSPEHGSPTVLILDDNDVVSDFLQSTLRAYGYRDLSAATPDQAVEHCQRQRCVIHALIADVGLGGLGGFETARMLMQFCPEMKVVFTSGYPFEHLVRAGMLPAHLGTSMFLQKPFLPSEIMSVLKFLLKMPKTA